MADWSGAPVRRMLSSAERLSDSAIFLGSSQMKILGSRSSALLRFVTSADQRRGFGVLFPMTDEEFFTASKGLMEYGAKQAKKMGINVEDDKEINRIIHDVRARRRERNRA
jgi:hypothetical protein